MDDSPRQTASDRQIIPARKMRARVAEVLVAAGNDFASEPVAELAVTYDGVSNDIHSGATRLSGSREPWYPRGTEMSNERQLSILSVEELAAIADGMGIVEVKAGWIGGNLVLEGIPDMTYLPPRTLLFFDGGVTLRVDGHNGPCRLAGGEIAKRIGSRRIGGPMGDPAATQHFSWSKTDMALAFTKAAWMKRGLVGWVEREGVIRPGEELAVHIWEQWIY